MSINSYSSGFNASNAVSPYQNSSYREEDDSSEHLFDLNRQPFSNSMEFDEKREFAVIKLENEDGPGSSMVIEEEDALVAVKDEFSLENPKTLLRINKEIKERIKKINPGYKPSKEIGIENCLPCTISFYNWIQSGSPYPEAVDPHAKPLYEHMFPANGGYSLLLDPFLDKLNNPKTILELDEEGKSREYVCLAEDHPLTFHSVPLTDLKTKIEKEIPWKQYENGTETFKLGILFLNHRNNDSTDDSTDDSTGDSTGHSTGHFLNFLYCKTESRKKKDAGSFTLYIIDPQSKEILTFKDFLKFYQFSYADDIKIWSGQNQINFNCNKTVKDMAKSLKTEEPEDQNPFVEYQHTDDVARSVDSVARKNTLKIKLNRPIEQVSDPEISKKSRSTPLKLSVQHDIFSKSSSDYSSDDSTDIRKSFGKPIRINFKRNREEDLESEASKKPRQNIDPGSPMADFGPELPIENPWARAYEMKSLNKENSWEMLDQYEDLDQDFAVDNEFIEKSVNKPCQIDLTQEKFSTDLTESLSANSIEIDLSKDDDVIVINSNNHPIKNTKNLTSRDADAELHYQEAQGYYFGNGVEVDLKAAFDHYKIAADKGHKFAQNSVGFMYSKGQGVESDLKEAFKYYKRAADRGLAPAQYSLGYMYFDGQGVERDYSSAFKYYTLAEKQDFALAQYAIGNMFNKGLGRKKNLTIAFKYFNRAAKNHYADAQYKVGKRYLEGSGDAIKDDKKAFDFLSAAADQGHVAACRKLVKMKLNAKEGHPNFKLKLKYIKVAIEHKDSAAQCILGEMYFTGQGIEKDLGKALEYYNLSIAQGNCVAECKLGEMYLKGDGVDLNIQEGLRLIQLSAEHGYSDAQFILGKMYSKGEVVELDFEKYIKYLKLAADQGHIEAVYELGCIYFKGEKGVPQSKQVALTLFEKAANQDHAESQGFAGRIHYEKDSLSPSRDRAKLYSKAGAAQNDPTAQATFGRILLNERALDKALKYSQFAADKGDAFAFGTLGNMYLHGTGVKKNQEIALNYSRQGADLNDALSLCNLGYMYFKGLGVEKDITQAFKYFKSSADNGDATAQNLLASAYLEGDGIEQNDEEAIKYLKLAADQGHIEAAYELGCIYFKGDKGVAQSNQVALPLFEKAANQGHAKSQGFAGRIYYEKDGSSAYFSALDYSHMGAEQNDPTAQATLGRIRLNSKDFAEAFKYSQLAAEKGDAFAFGTLGNMYLHGTEVEKNHKKALEYSRLGAAQNDALSLCNLGHMYFKGLGVEKDVAKAFIYSKLAADKGDATAQNNVGSAYLEGDGIEQNYEEAIKYLKLSSKQGKASASYTLGLIYLKGGAGVPKDIQEAIKYFEGAAKSGHDEAQGVLGRMYFENEVRSRNSYYGKEAILRYSKKAADQNNAMGQGTLGMMYLEGKGVPQNIEEGLKYINLAVVQEDAGAQRTLGMLLIEGEIILKNIMEGLKYINLAVAQGDAGAQRTLGMLLIEGKVGLQNNKEGLRLLKLAAGQDDAAALYALGEIYSSGEIVPGDSNNAIKYYRLALEQGCEKAKAKLDGIDAFLD